MGSVNFPQLAPRFLPGSHRILNIHWCVTKKTAVVLCTITNVLCTSSNVPGVLRDLNTILEGYNVSQQQLNTTKEIGYAIIDVDKVWPFVVVVVGFWIFTPFT